jgi:Zn-dependent peptidase ImmA (M78 family)/DNA-binding XRE family transcriptional regulator
MIGQNIKRYRTLKGISLRKFGELVGLSHMAIKKYEQGELMPDGDKLVKFAEVLDCKVSELLKDNSNRKELDLTFRKRKSLTGKKLELLKQIVNDKVNNYLDVLELNTIESIKIKKYKVNSVLEAEDAANKFRKEHQINEVLPLTNLCDIIENLGIAVIIIKNDKNIFEGFDGVSQVVDGVPFICISADINYYRQRFTLAHELGHLILDINDELDEEEICNEFASSLLLPRKALINECGEKRTLIYDNEYKIIREEYKISIKAIIYRLRKYGIITENHAKLAYINYNRFYKVEEYENTNKQTELPRKYEQLVLRLYAQNLITQSRYNELMEDYIIDG